MPIVTPSPAVEEWLTEAAERWNAVSDREYRELVAQWRAAFGAILERGAGVQAADALQRFEARLPAAVFLFNGVTVPRVATGINRHPSAYRALGLRRLHQPLANDLDLVLVDHSLSFCCVCTHEWQALAHPIFLQRAA